MYICGMNLDFFKYQGTGNDFVIIDNRQDIFPKNNKALVAKLCNRKFGIGADGLILLENAKDANFTMAYFNADGAIGSMCGNGGRCIVAFAKHLGIIEEQCIFIAADGLHRAYFSNHLVSLKMNDVHNIKKGNNYVFLDTGSPHHIVFVPDVDKVDVFNEGKTIRYGKPYFENGTNVNYVSQNSNGHIAVRTYERGVEDETLSCGTGVTAVALAAHFTGKTDKENIKIATRGGNLQVSFKKLNGIYKDIYLTGPAEQVFKGTINI